MSYEEFLIKLKNYIYNFITDFIVENDSQSFKLVIYSQLTNNTSPLSFIILNNVENMDKDMYIDRDYKLESILEKYLSRVYNDAFKEFNKEMVVITKFLENSLPVSAMSDEERYLVDIYKPEYTTLILFDIEKVDILSDHAKYDGFDFSKVKDYYFKRLYNFVSSNIGV